MGVITGEEYLRRINALCSTIWCEGKRVKGKLSEHPAFRGVMKSQSELYDLQLEKENMIFEENGEKFGLSYLIPHSKEDLKKRRHMIQEWATYNGGMMGRSPDYMNTVIAAFAASLHKLEGESNAFPAKIEAFYKRARKHDLSFTHAFISPQTNRSKYSFLDDEVTNARIVRKTEEGIVLKGAKLLATQGSMTDEVLVYSTPGTAHEEESYLFSIPTDTKGLTFVCRSSFAKQKSTYNAPLSSRFDEMDTVVLFDDVLVPWERVFIYENLRAVSVLYNEGYFAPFTLHQIVSRQVVKAEFVLGIAKLIVEMININEYEHVQGKIAEMIRGLESLKGLLLQGEETGSMDNNGVFVPNSIPLYIAVNEFQNFYPRCTELLQQLGASGMVTIPTEEDFQSEVSEELKYYLKGYEKDGDEKVKLFRLAWDVSMSEFATRQILYERFFFGDPVRLAQTIYQKYNMSRAEGLAKKFLT